MAPITLTKDNFEEEVLNSDKPVLIDFWADWCTPCMIVSPVIEEIANETTTAVVGKVNIDQQPELAEAFQVMSIPTFAVMKDGVLVNSSVGVQGKEAILKLLDI